MNKSVNILLSNYQNDAENLKTEIMEFGKGFSLSSHSHSFFHINFVVSGQVKVQTQKGALSFDKGKLFIIPPMLNHAIYTESGYAQVGMDLQKVPNGNAYQILSDSVNNYINVYDFGFMLKDYYSLFGNIKQTPVQRMLLNNFSERLMLTAISFSEDKDHYRDFRAKVLNALQNAKYSITVGELGSMLFLSKTSLERYMHKSFSMSPKEYLNYWRLSKIYYFLLETELKIEVIAREMDFYDTAHFITFFKNQTGKTPSAFRKKERYNASSNMLP